jgi:GDPmannose 4,6-dehydratase
MAFAEVGVELDFKGKHEKEVGVVVKSEHPEYKIKEGRQVVAVDRNYYRPTEVDLLIGDAGKARRQLKWKPKYTLPMLVKEMVSADVQLFKKEKLLQQSGFSIKNQYE